MFYLVTVITTMVRILKIKKQNLNKLALPSDITKLKKIYIYTYIYIYPVYFFLVETHHSLLVTVSKQYFYL